MDTKMPTRRSLTPCVYAWLLLVGGCGDSADPQSLGAVESYAVVDRDWSLQLPDVTGRVEEVTVASGESLPRHQVDLERVRNLALQTFPNGEWTNFGPDSSFREIALTCERGQIVLRSWHPLFELNPKLVAGSMGVTALEGQTRDQFLAADNPEYVRKREAFDTIEEVLLTLATGDAGG